MKCLHVAAVSGCLLLVLGSAAQADSTLSLTPASADVGQVVVLDSGSVDFVLENTDVDSLEITDVSLTGSADFGHGFAVPQTIAGGASVVLTVMCTPSDSGLRSATLNITSDATNNPTPSATVDCTGIKPDIQATPNPRSFPDTDVGNTSTRDVTIENVGNGVLRVTALSIIGTHAGDFAFTPPALPLMVPPGGSVDVAIDFIPTDYQPDPRTATFRITSDDQELPNTDVTLNGTGRAGDIDAPLSRVFSDTRIGEFTDSVIALDNNGNKTLNLSSVVVGNGPGQNAFSLQGAAPTSISPGGSVNVTVRFTPNASQTFSGNLVVTSDDPDQAVRVVMLSGRGLTVQHAFLNAPANFGQIDIDGAPASRVVTIRNTGEAPFVFSNATLANDTNFTITDQQTGALDPDDTRTVTVQSVASPEGGDISTQIIFNVDIPGVPQLFVDINATGVDPAISASLLFLDFQGIDVQSPQSTVLSVDILNTGTGTLQIEDISVSGTAAALYNILGTTSSISIPEGGLFTAEVEYQPIAESSGDEASLVVNAENRPPFNISLNGRGIDRHLELATLDVVFPPTFRNPETPTRFDLDIMNTGEARLAVAGVMLVNAGGAFSVVDPQFTEIGPRGVGTITIEFSPSMVTEASLTGELFIMNDDDDTPMARVPLSGVAILPSLDIAPGVVDFGQVGVGVTSEVGLRVPIVAITNGENDVAHTVRGIRVVGLSGLPVDPSLFVVRGLPEPRSLAAGDTLELEIEFRPVVAGRFEYVMELLVGADPLPVRTAPITAEAVEVKLRGGGCRAGGDAGGGLALLLVVALATLARRRSRFALGAVFFSLAAGTTAHAQATRDIELGTFRAAQGTVVDFVTVDTPLVASSNSWAANVTVDHAVDPLSVSSGAAPDITDTPVSQRSALEVGFTYALLDRVEAALSIPLLLTKGSAPMISGIEPAEGTALGDVTLRGKLHVGTFEVFSLGVAINASIPTATADKFAGAAGFGIAAKALAGVRAGRFAGSINLGVRARQRGRLGDVVQGNDFIFAGAVAVRVADRVSVISELYGAAGLSGEQSAGTSPLEALLAVRYQMNDRWSVSGGVGRGVLPGIGTPSVRGFLGALFSTGAEGTRAGARPRLDPEADDDDDGVRNDADRCAQLPEDKDGFEDDDGCPDPDNDGDKIVDSADKCPDEPEDRDGFQDADGCIDGDNDNDGLLDPVDKCPDEPEDEDGFEDEDGCDDVDNDADGVPDVMDACPTRPETKNGYKDGDGCPDRRPRRGRGRR